MSPIDGEASRRSYPLGQSAAALLLVGTTIFPLQVGSSTPGIGAPYSYEQSIANPFGVATNNVSRIEAYANSTLAATGVVPNYATKWDRYVTRRLFAFRLGAGDFTGLKIPTPQVVDQAWILARSFFHPDTPAPSVVPTEDGEIMFIWHKAGWELQIETGPEGAMAWARDRRSGITWSGSLEERQEELYSLFRLFAQR